MGSPLAEKDQLLDKPDTCVLFSRAAHGKQLSFSQGNSMHALSSLLWPEADVSPCCFPRREDAATILEITGGLDALEL